MSIEKLLKDFYLAEYTEYEDDGGWIHKKYLLKTSYNSWLAYDIPIERTAYLNKKNEVKIIKLLDLLEAKKGGN